MPSKSKRKLSHVEFFCFVFVVWKIGKTLRYSIQRDIPPPLNVNVHQIMSKNGRFRRRHEQIKWRYDVPLSFLRERKKCSCANIFSVRVVLTHSRPTSRGEEPELWLYFCTVKTVNDAALFQCLRYLHTPHKKIICLRKHGIVYSESI